MLGGWRYLLNIALNGCFNKGAVQLYTVMYLGSCAPFLNTRTLDRDFYSRL